MTSDAVLQNVLKDAIKKAGVWGVDQQLTFPLITKSGVNQEGKPIHYYFNYSATPGSITYPHRAGSELLSNTIIASGASIAIEPWGVKIVEEN